MKILLGLISKLIRGISEAKTMSKNDKIEASINAEDEDCHYDINKVARTTLPAGYKLTDKKLYWQNQELRLPHLIRSTFFYNQTLLAICDSKCSGSNILAFDIHGNQLWTIDPIPYSSSCPEYEFVEANNGRVFVLHGPNMFEVNMDTGKIGVRISSHWR